MVVVVGIILSGYTTTSSKAAILAGYTANEIVAMMDKGFNMGNTLDATGGSRADLLSQEKSWGNPAVTKELMAGVKAAGFNTIRIPTTWYKHVSVENGYKIDDEWMAHVKEIVTWAYENDLFIILNIHHESWLNVKDLGENYVAIGEELSAIWSQIAENFAEFDQHLIFEGMNEPRAVGISNEWTGSPVEYNAVNYLNQLFVDTVRDNGKGYNSERVLMVTPYAASSSASVLKALKLPERNGATASNLAVSVHCYNPYDFCLSDNQSTFNPKNSADTSGITSMFSAIRELFLNNDIPVIIGECGCTNTHDNLESRLLWFDYFGGKAREYGVPAVVWDNGAKGKSGGECHNYFNRSTGEATSQDLIDAFILGYTPGPKEGVSQTITFEPIKQDGATLIITPAEAGFLPKDLSCQMKINHTADATTGFALKIQPSTKDQTASFSLAGYAGKDVVISGYLYSEENVNVAYGYSSSAELTSSSKTECGKIATNKGWQKFAFRLSVSENPETFYVTGEEGKTFYLDDFSVTIVDATVDVAAVLDMSENASNDNFIDTGNSDAGTSDPGNVVDKPDGGNGNTGNSTAENDNINNSAQSDGGSEGTASSNDDGKKDGFSVSPMIFGVIPVLAIVIIFITRKRKK